MQNFKRQLMGNCLALMALALSSTTGIQVQAQYQLTPFVPPGLDLFFPTDINNNGTITVNAFGLPGSVSGPVLINGDSVMPISLNMTNLRISSLEGINGHGTTVGWATEDFSSSFGFVRTKHGRITILTVPGFNSTRAFGISDHGVVVGSVADKVFLGPNHGFIWDPEGPKLFDAPGADSTVLTAINASGTAVGDYDSSGATHAFVLSKKDDGDDDDDDRNRDKDSDRDDDVKFQALNIPNALSSSASDINNHGVIAGNYQSSEDTNVYHGFVYYRGAVITVHYPFSDEVTPPSFPPEPFDFGDLGTGTVTFVRSGRFTEVTGINDRGDIVGRANTLYDPVVDCGGCGLGPADFYEEVVWETFTGERDDSGRVSVRHGRSQDRQKSYFPHGTYEREFRGRKR